MKKAPKMTAPTEQPFLTNAKIESLLRDLAFEKARTKNLLAALVAANKKLKVARKCIELLLEEEQPRFQREDYERAMTMRRPLLEEK